MVSQLFYNSVHGFLKDVTSEILCEVSEQDPHVSFLFFRLGVFADLLVKRLVVSFFVCILYFFYGASPDHTFWR